MTSLSERLRNTTVGREVSWLREKNRYQRTREPRLHAAQEEAGQLIDPLFPAARKPGSPEAKLLILIGANVTSHVVSEVCDPDTQVYLNGILEPVQGWATGTGDLEAVLQARGSFRSSGLYRDHFYMINNPNPVTIKETKRIAQAVDFVDETLLGAVALDSRGIVELDIADKRGTAELNYETFITGAADPGVFSIAYMNAAWHKMGLNMEYSRQADSVAAIPLHSAAVAVGRFYGLEPGRNTSNPLFQERINGIIKNTINP